MNARMRRIASDYEQIKKNFSNHKNIVVEPIGEEPAEKYRVTYYVNGIYLLDDGRIETLGKHIVIITLHAEYPRYKPVCTIATPIWHPNFRDGQICIGDIWGAGESLSDIIINIGDMIQYKSWNSFSPLSADAAKWAMENKHLFPVGHANLFKADEALENSLQANIEIEEEKEINADTALFSSEPVIGNDFEIAPEELEGITFVPTAEKMQNIKTSAVYKSKRVDFKTIFKKGILWGLIGGVAGFILQLISSEIFSIKNIVSWMGEDYSSLSLQYLFGSEEVKGVIKNATTIYSGMQFLFISLAIGLFMGLGEGLYYGNKRKAAIYSVLGAGISGAFGFASGCLAQNVYGNMMENTDSLMIASLVRALCWAIAGIGIGFSVGIIKPEKKRLVFCTLGGIIGGFAGGFLFNWISVLVMICAFATKSLAILSSTEGISQIISMTCMGALVGLGIGLLEQFAKIAWLKVTRGEFEGKEYLVFPGTTTIGNTGKNMIVLFKDRMVAPNHCDIVTEGNRYFIVDRGSGLGTIVNGVPINRQLLKHGDTIAIGNTVLIFNTK